MAANTIDPGVSKFQPANADITIWRYMDVTALLFLAQTRLLHFSPLEHLSDTHEGHDTQVGVQLAHVRSNSPESAEFIRKVTASFVRSNTYVNCWTCNPKESAALWQLYGSRGTVVALRSTYSKLRDVLPGAFVIGQIRYIDYSDVDHIEIEADSTFPFISYAYHKRLEFAFEQEVRAAYVDTGKLQPNISKYRGGGVQVIVDLSSLVDAVYIRSTEPAWTIDTFRGLCKNYDLELIESQIDASPRFIQMTDRQHIELVKRYLKEFGRPKSALTKSQPRTQPRMP